MSVGFEQNTMDVDIILSEDHVALTKDSKDVKYNYTLPLYRSIIGELDPTLAPLAIDYTINSETAHRYDWVVGLGEPSGVSDWHSTLRPERTISVQLSIASNDSGLSFSDSSPMLLGLQPSLETESWWDRHVAAIRESMRQAAGIATPVLPGVVPGAIQIASNFITSGDQRGKNWWMYRFLEKDKKSIVIEWNINHKVLVEYGPLVRGSVALSFHGERKENGDITLLLRAGVGFDRRKNLEYLPSWDKMEEKNSRVALTVKPTVAKPKDSATHTVPNP
jgi:hypothetical protein